MLALLAAAPAISADQPHDEIRRTAAEYVLAQAGAFPVVPEVQAGDLDSRLRLPQCSRPIEAFAPPNGLKAGRTVVGVTCEGEQPWKLYVPVEVRLPGEVVVAARPLRRGDILTRQDLALVTRDLASLHRDYFQAIAPLLGQRMRRALSRDAVLTPKAVETRKVVRRGTEVTILAADARLQVRMRGKALDSGASGDRIKVENLSSGREIYATVVGQGLVRVLH
jgi:flagella basal body P-ring formation protein FlgA